MILSYSDMVVEIASRAKALRLAHNMRQDDLALKIGVSASTIKRFEKDGSGSIELLCKIAFALNAERELAELFPLMTPKSIDDLTVPSSQKQRARKRNVK